MSETGAGSECAAGHVDDLARFVGPDTVVTVIEEDPADENHAPLQENLRRLRSMSDERGRPLRIVELPMPRRIEYEGWSSQAKAGMVRITVAEFQTFVDKAVRSLPK